MSGRVVVLTGGVGGAKLVLGLAQIMPQERITAIVNTGDDFRHLGLHVSPDIDTLLYTLSGKASVARGWGRESESWNFMEALCSLEGPDWFALGDGDLALHVLRTARLNAGTPLSAITEQFAKAWQIGVRILPMSNDPVSTHLDTDEGPMSFQTYFVARRCEPKVKSIGFMGGAEARAAPGVIDAILEPMAEVRAVLIAPSNPYLSIDPILALTDIRDALARAKVPVVAVSPLVGGKAVKGPTAKLMGELLIPVTPCAIAAHYAGVIQGLLIDERDSAEGVEIACAKIDTLMLSLDDRMRVARAALELAQQIAR